MSDTIDILKKLALQVRNAVDPAENTAERVGRVLVGLLENLNSVDLEELAKTFLRKDQPDAASEVITFLKGLLVGDNVASINEDGDAEVRNLIAHIKATVAVLEAKTVTVSDKVTTLNLLVQKLAEIYDLNVSNVATLFQTIVKDYVSSESFVPGITGEGFKLYKALSGDWNLEVDNVVIRKAMTIFELIVSKVRAVNGGLVVSPANGRIKSVTETTGSPTYYVLGIEGDMTFVADDLVRCQVFSSTGAKYYWVPIDSVSAETILILKSNFPDGVVPAVGDDLVQMGNKTNTARQGVLYLTASEDGKPRFSVLDGVNSTDLTGKSKVILGCLDGITDSDFPSDAQPHGYGLWAGNVFLKGLFILRNGKSIEDELSDQITAVQTAFEIREGQISTKVTQATTAAQTATAKAGEAATSAGTASTKASEAAGSATTAGQKATDANNAANNAATILQTVTQKETNIIQTADAIELKATRAESAAGRAESAEASINVKADGIVLQASNQAAQTAVDGVQVGGVNILPKSKDFSGASYYHNLISETYNGFPVIAYENVSGSYVDILAWNGLLTPKINSYYTLSFWCKGTGTVLSYFYPGTVESGYTSDGSSTTSSDGSIATALTSDWKRIWIVWKTLPTQTEAKNVLVARLFNGSFGYICGVKFEEGNKATTWTSAPEDITADYTARIEVLNKEISSKVSQIAFDSLSGRVDTQGTAITQLPNTIDARITTQSQAGGIIKTQVESWFTLSGNTLSLGAKSFNITGATIFNSLATNDSVANAVNAVKVGGKNYIRNGGKFANTNYWTLFDQLVGGVDQSVTIRSDSWTAGEPALQIYITSYMSGQYGVYQDIPTILGQQYTFTCLIAGHRSFKYIKITDELNNPIIADTLLSSNQDILGGANINDWLKPEFTFVATSTTTRIVIYIAGTSNDSKFIWIKDVMMSIGNKALAWSPAPEDVNTAISTAQTAAVTTARNNLAKSLGYADYSAMEAQATTNNTIIDGNKIRTSLINADAIVTNGLAAKTIDAKNATISNLTVNNAKVIGSLRNPFTYVGDAFTTDYNDNVAVLSSPEGGWTDVYNLPWDISQSGRRITIVNYKWGSAISQSTAITTAPSGCVFYEDGVAKSLLKLSREAVELLGYGDKSAFYGWIVVRRIDIMTERKYGKPLKVLAQGIAGSNNNSAWLTRYKTFDNSTLTISWNFAGRVRINFPASWGLFINQYIVMLTGYGDVFGGSTPCKAHLYAMGTSYFEVDTSDDDSRNAGSFMFQIINLNDWY